MSRRRDHAETTVRRGKLYPLPNGEQVEIKSLGLNDYVQAREEALAQFKRQRIATWTRNADLLANVSEADRRALLRDAFERAEVLTVEDLPAKTMTLPFRTGKNGKFARDAAGGLITRQQAVEYTAWWMSETPEGRLYMTWLSVRRSKPDFTIEDADEIFRDHMEALEKIADDIGEISGPNLGNSSEPPDPAPAAEVTATETPEEKRKRRRQRRQTGR
jgi:hypothetical protein